MRIVTWNCCRGDVWKKADAVRALAPDLLLMQEVTPFESREDALFAEVTKGLGVATFAFNEFRIDQSRAAGSGLHTHVTGPAAFDVLNVWTRPMPRYVDDALACLRLFDDVLAPGNAVIAGDFNVSATLGAGHGALLTAMQSVGYVSAYHSFHDLEHGAERHPTLYWRWKQKQPFHIDYCYVPITARVERVDVGGFEEWAAWSDHRPVIVDVSL